MKPHQRIARKPVTLIAMALLAAVGLLACGGHSTSDGGDSATPMPAVDAYFTAVSATVASAPDDTEPVSIDAVVATAPEDTEAQPLG